VCTLRGCQQGLVDAGGFGLDLFLLAFNRLVGEINPLPKVKHHRFKTSGLFLVLGLSLVIGRPPPNHMPFLFSVLGGWSMERQREGERERREREREGSPQKASIFLLHPSCFASFFGWFD
jgi:hypothetical protein